MSDNWIVQILENNLDNWNTKLNLNDKNWDVPCITLEINIED